MTKLDRLARSAPDARAIGDEPARRGIKLSLGGQVSDSADPIGEKFYSILSIFVEFEVDLLRARTREGMAVARAKGKLTGRAPKLSVKQQRELTGVSTFLPSVNRSMPTLAWPPRGSCAGVSTGS